jgi:probable rRNA maturation factor
MVSSKTPPVHFHILQNFSLAQRRELKVFLANIFRKEGAKLNELNYIFCPDEYLLGINQQYLKHDFYTDIITFNLAEKGQPVSGEIYISVDRVRENAKTLGTSFREEMLRVIFHGVLHLCGYKDKTKQQEKEMRGREDYYLRKFLK